MNRLLEVLPKNEDLFLDILDEHNIDAVCPDDMPNGKTRIFRDRNGYRQIRFLLRGTITIEYSQLKARIQAVQDTKGVRHAGRIARIYFSLYATGYLVIKNHIYPSYADWQRYNPDMTIDHKLPKDKFPTKAFYSDNWIPMKYKANQAKGNRV